MNKNKEYELCTSIRMNYSYQTLKIAYCWLFFGLSSYFCKFWPKAAKKALNIILIILIQLFLFIGLPELTTQRSVLHAATDFICLATLVLKINALARTEMAQRELHAKPTVTLSAIHAIPDLNYRVYQHLFHLHQA